MITPQYTRQTFEEVLREETIAVDPETKRTEL